jgi:adenylate cyclase
VKERRPEILARHFEEGGEVIDAATHWHQAGLLALGRAAYVEALQQLQRGAALVERLPASPERSRLEVELLTALGTAHVSTRGFGAEEVRPIFARARSLCEDLGDTVSLQVLGGLYGAGVTTGDARSTEEILPHFRRLAERDGDPLAAFAGNQVLGVQAFWTGDPATARTHLARAMELYRRDEVRGLAWEYGYGLYCYGYGVLTLFELGLPDLAEATRREMTAFAEASGNPYCVAIALGFGLTLTRDRGEIDLTADLAERLLALANEQHLYFWASFAHCGLGSALQRRGHPDEGAARIRQGLDLLKMLGVRSSYAYYLTFLGSALLDAGRIEDGLAAVDESMALSEVLIARAQVPELWRLRGELLARRGDRPGAEAALRSAIAVSRERSAKGYELRGLAALARLLEGGEGGDGVRASLRALYAELREGFDTADLRDAKSLL